jgi:REP element-mobilizing transposase RayT
VPFIFPGRTWGGKRTLRARIFWARGYFVLTVGTEEENIRRQEKEDRRLDQLSTIGEEPPSGGQ